MKETLWMRTLDGMRDERIACIHAKLTERTPIHAREADALTKAIAIIEEASALVDFVSKDTLRDDVFRTMNYNSEMSLKRLIALINEEEASSNE